MTEEQFDNIRFGGNDEIIVKHYLCTLRLKVESVDFSEQTINGYPLDKIIEYIEK